MTAGPMVAPAPRALDELLGDVRVLARRLDRDDLAERIDEIQRRAARSETVICVVGEFKKGKSALVNALLGAPTCPVDDDLATMAVTVVRHGETPSAIIHRREGGEPVIESIDPDALADWTLERAGQELRRDVDLVEVRAPNPLLEGGLTLVDTPGVGGLNAGHAAATLAFLPSADALIFVTDTSAELSAPELEFLASARGAGPPVLIAATKIDMYPEWRRIIDLDADHLAAIGLVERPFGLSSTLRLDPGEHDDESGYAAFATVLREDVVGRARIAAQAAAAADTRWVLGQLHEPLVAERAGLETPEAAARIAGEVGICPRAAGIATPGRCRLVDAARRRVLRPADARRLRLPALPACDPARGADRDRRDRPGERVAGPQRPAPDRHRDDGPRRLPRCDDRGCQRPVDDRLHPRGGGRRRGRGPRDDLRRRRVLVERPLVRGTDEVPDQGRIWARRPVPRRVSSCSVSSGRCWVPRSSARQCSAWPRVYGGKEVLDERRRRLVDRRQQARTFVGDLIEEIRFQIEGRFDEPVSTRCSARCGFASRNGSGSCSAPPRQRRSARPRGAQGCSGPSRASIGGRCGARGDHRAGRAGHDPSPRALTALGPPALSDGPGRVASDDHDRPRRPTAKARAPSRR